VKALPASLRGALMSLLLCTSGHLAAAQGTYGGAPSPDYRLDQLAVALRDAPGPQRAAFARAALTELAEAYAMEAAHARREARQHLGNADLRRWAASVDALAQELAIRGERVTDATHVHLRLNPDNSVAMIVDGTPVELNGPRSRDQVTLERAVIERFCSRNPCADLVGAPGTTLAQESAPGASPHWSFSEGSGPVCRSHDGLEFRFEDTQDLRRKRETCARAVAELRALAAEIAHYKASGRQVRWEDLAIRRLPGGDGHRVELQREGGYLELYLPLLASTPELLRLAQPWLVARSSDLDHELVVRDAESLLPIPGFLGE
jgi:hypothetical protein